ncbi:MAG: putative glycosyl transferase [Bacteroidetes bacterium ADurb.Bin302]|nr:MAG: putative glycosyl transferase [Bacteroidetes bacterium ADurb.Bin302]
MIVPVILLNYNSSSDCRKCVSFLKRQQGIGLEIIIVDNCSREDDCIEVKKLCQEQGCTFIQASENRGYNAGNNIGLRYAAEKGYEYALIANPDMEFPQEDYIKKLVAKMEQDDTIAVCASDIVNPDGRHQNPQREVTYNEELFWFMEILRNRKSKKWYLCDFTQSGYCEKVSGCCLLLRIDFVQNIGFFDENVFLYSEESILAKQVKLTNKRAYYLADSQAIHQHIESQKGASKLRMKILFKSRNYYLHKYSGYYGLKLQLLLLFKHFQKLTIK